MKKIISTGKGVVILVIAAIGVFSWIWSSTAPLRISSGEQDSSLAQLSEQLPLETREDVNDKEVSKTPPQVQTPPPQVTIPIPDINKPIVIITGLSEESAKAAREKLEAAISDLKGNSNLYSSWLELGIYRKLIGDYKGAEEAWLYASVIVPAEGVPDNNLANLYMNELEDFVKAEVHLLAAIRKQPSQSLYYQNAYEFYRFILKDEARARAVLEEGIAAHPANKEPLEHILKSF